jgi:hypothetical protein
VNVVGSRIVPAPAKSGNAGFRERSLSHFLVERASPTDDTRSSKSLWQLIFCPAPALPPNPSRRSCGAQIGGFHYGREETRMFTRRWRRGRLVVLSVLAGAGCAEIERAIHAPGRSDVVDGEIWSIDARGSRIDVRSVRGGTVTMRYDRNTRVFYERREYEPTALEEGDQVRALTSRDRNGTLWADRIDVLRSVRDAAPGRVERIDGVFGRFEPGRGYFTVVAARETLFVYIPRNVREGDLRRLERLRPGDRVRIDVRVFGRGELELARFR